MFNGEATVSNSDKPTRSPVFNDLAYAQRSMYSHMLSASNNHAKIGMVSKNDNQKVTTDKYNLFSSNSIPCTKQRPRKVLIKMKAA